MSGQASDRLDRRQALKYAGLVSTGTLLAGCSGDSGTDETTTTAGPGDDTDTTAGNMDDPSGTDIVYATTITPNTLDPMKASDNLDSILAHNIYDPLVYYTDDTPPELIPWLAEDWTVSDDNRTYTFTLRDGATFHNGDSVTAEDVVYSAQRMLEMQRGFSWMFAGVLSPDNVTAVDESTVEMQLDRVFAPFVFTLPYLFIVNKSVVEENAKADGEFGENGDYGTGYLESNDAGGGPYTLGSRSRKQEIVLEKNDDWWGSFTDGNTYETAVVNMLPETATVVGSMNDQSADMSDQWLSLQSYQEMAQKDYINVSSKATFNPFYIFMHTQREPLNNIHVRKAISYAFDYEQAINGVLAGDSQQLQGPLPSAMWGHNSDVTVYEKDLDKAKAELDKSPYTADEISPTYTYVSGLTIEQNHGLLLQSNLQELGIDLSIEKAQWTNITSNVTEKQSTPDMLAIYLSFRYADPDTFLYPAWHSSQHGSWQSAAWYQNDEVDSLLTEARQTVGKDKRIPLYQEAQQLIAEDAPALFVANQATRYAINTRVKGFNDNGVTGYTHTFHRLREGSN